MNQVNRVPQVAVFLGIFPLGSFCAHLVHEPSGTLTTGQRGGHAPASARTPRPDNFWLYHCTPTAPRPSSARPEKLPAPRRFLWPKPPASANIGTSHTTFTGLCCGVNDEGGGSWR